MRKASKFGEIFREKFHYEGKLTRKEMGPELWNEYYKIIQKNKIKSEKHKKELEERASLKKGRTKEKSKLRKLNGDQYKKYCKTPELVENFYEAQKDSFKGWVCHHKLEQMFTAAELITMGIYYNCKPGELMFIRKSEHNNNAKLHYGCRIRDMSKSGRPKKCGE